MLIYCLIVDSCTCGQITFVCSLNNDLTLHICNLELLVRTSTCLPSEVWKKKLFQSFHLWSVLNNLRLSLGSEQVLEAREQSGSDNTVNGPPNGYVC